MFRFNAVFRTNAFSYFTQFPTHREFPHSFGFWFKAVSLSNEGFRFRAIFQCNAAFRFDAVTQSSEMRCVNITCRDALTWRSHRSWRVEQGGPWQVTPKFDDRRFERSLLDAKREADGDSQQAILCVTGQMRNRHGWFSACALACLIRGTP